VRSGFVDWRWVFLAVFSSLLLVTRLRGEEKEKKKERKREKKERKRKKTSWKKGGRVKGRKGLPNLRLSVSRATTHQAAWPLRSSRFSHALATFSLPLLFPLTLRSRKKLVYSPTLFLRDALFFDAARPEARRADRWRERPQGSSADGRRSRVGVKLCIGERELEKERSFSRARS